MSRVQLQPPRLDAALLAGVLTLLGIGLVMVLSASGVMAERVMGDKYHYFVRQAAFATAGLGVMAFFAWVPRTLVIKLRYLWVGAAVLLVGLTLAGPLAQKAGGATRWLNLGPVGVQPLEFAKLALVIYLAYFFSAKQQLLDSFSKGFCTPAAVTLLLAAMLIKQPDYGGAVMTVLIFVAMAWVGGARFGHLLGTSVLAGGLGYMLLMSADYRVKRLKVFLDPFADPLGDGYQLVQSLYALGSGGPLGVGLGASRQKLLFLPEAHNDFLMAVVGEELGFAGMSLIFVLVGLVLWRGLAIAWGQEELQDRLLAFGCTMLLALGFLLNLAVVLGAAPPKGVAMPLLSYGGSNLLASLAAAGLLINCSRSVVRTGKSAKQRGAKA